VRSVDSTSVCCQKWAHKKCSERVAVTSAGRTSVDIGASAKLELVDKFCCLCDMLSVDGDADAAVEARIRIAGINSGSWYHCLPLRTYHWL